jgi:hypothetical protein
VNYKSGIQEEFWCTYFTIKGDEYTWTTISNGNRPLGLKADNIESVWQVGYDKPLFNFED